MTSTSTQHSFIETHLHSIDDAVHSLGAGDLILFPTDTLWSVGCDLENPVALIRLARLKLDHDDYPIELLVSSVNMLKKYVRHLHPRLETLLDYHTRPLSIAIEEPVKLPKELNKYLPKAVFRLVREGTVHQLIERFGRPLVATFAYRKDHPLPINMGVISSDILESIDKVYNFNGQESANNLPVMVELSDKEELMFLRE